MREYFLHGVHIDRKRLLLLFCIYISASNWYYIFSKFFILDFLGTVSEILQSPWIHPLFDFFIAGSILSFGFLVKRTNTFYLIYGWSITSSISIIMLKVISGSGITLFLLPLLGIISGAGILAYTIFFFNQTETSERGRVGGAIVSLSTLISPLFFNLASIFSWEIICIFLSIVPLVGLLIKPKKRKHSWDNTRGKFRELGYYLLSWIILCTANGLLQGSTALRFKELFPQSFSINTLLQYFSASLGSIIGGVLADWVGRKMILLFGLLLNGAGNAIVGLVLTPATHHIAYPVSGFSWGVFLVIFYLVIWGELSTEKDMVLLYSLELTIFHLTRGLGYLFTPHTLNTPIVNILLFNSLLLFISLIPLIPAREPFPEDLSNKMRFEIYQKRVKNFIKKHGG